MKKSLFIGLAATSLFATSATGRNLNYIETLKRVAVDEELYANFRREPSIINAYEHVHPNSGVIFYNIIDKKYNYLFEYKDQFQINEKFGNPNLYDFNKLGMISTTTMRYIFILGEILEMFDLPEGCKIAEVGCGYGGQCSIISRVKNFSKYELIDLIESLPLINRYLNDAGVKNFLSTDMDNCGKENSYDLFISNYGLSECDKKIQKTYIDKVVSKCTHGYILYNYIPGVTTHVYPTSEFCDILRSYGLDPKCKEETVQTNLESKNMLIYW